MASIHETMEALHEVSAIDKRTMRHFDDACLTSKPGEPAKGAPAALGVDPIETVRVGRVIPD